jgi:hypothetical protein
LRTKVTEFSFHELCIHHRGVRGNRVYSGVDIPFPILLQVSNLFQLIMD